MKKLGYLRNLIAAVAAGLLMFLALPGTAQAQSLKMGLDEMAAQADSVLTGIVVEQKSWWNAEHSHIFTSVEMNVAEKLKGSTEENKVSITVPGGDVNGIREYVTDTPAFFAGEEVLVFLKQRDGENHVLGGHQGKFAVTDGSIGKVPLAEFKSFISENSQGLSLSGDEEKIYASTKPVINSIEPDSASAGTNDQVIINGGGFGDAGGYVYFFYQSGQPRIKGDIISWSDTSIVTTVPAYEINGYPASACSGPVYVRTAAGVNSGSVPFTVTFSYGGIKWPGSDPVFNYRINPNTPDCIGEETSVKAAANTWNSVSGKAFTFNYAGSTKATMSSYDGLNEICWTNMGGSGTLASTSVWFSGDTILECDIEFNEYYNWSVGNMDIQTIALHEFGHCLNLNDLYGDETGYPTDSDKVMFGYGSSGELKTSLHSHDQAGICWIYPCVSSLPSVQTDNATDITTNTARLNGSIASNGGADIVEYGFYWGTGSDPAIRIFVGADNYSSAFSAGLTGLAAGVTYYVKAYAVNSAGTSYGDIKQFTTEAATVPVVQTNYATNISATGAALNGDITSNGGSPITEYGFYWGTGPDPETRVVVGTDNYSGQYSYLLSALSPNIYYFKTYATNSAGTGYGEVKNAAIFVSGQKNDVNGDENINVQDVVLTVNIILGKVTPTSVQRYAADANSDDVINVQDVVKIVNVILGKA